MKQRAREMPVIASLILLSLTLATWVSAFFVDDRISHVTTSVTPPPPSPNLRDPWWMFPKHTQVQWTLAALPSGVELSRDQSVYAEAAPAAALTHVPSGWFAGGDVPAFFGPFPVLKTDHAFLGFLVGHQDYEVMDVPHVDGAYWRAKVPFWFLSVLFGAYPLWVWSRRRIERRRAGLCPICSYDLRAHKPGDKCPECGTLIAAR